MSKKKTTEQFIEEARNVHGDTYSYTNAVYTGADNKLIITCKEHGDFLQRAAGHTVGYGCKKCATTEASRRITKTTEEFIDKATEVHLSKYSYVNSVYKGAKDKIVITCPIHGDFKQNAGDHLAGKGCKKCGNLLTGTSVRAMSNRVSVEEFISRSEDIHKNVYDYSMVEEFNTTVDKVQIGCPLHGMFWQQVSKHLLGHGCRKCGSTKVNNGWSYTLWEAAGVKSENFDSFKVYLIKCYSDKETFYKVGKTFKTVGDRFKKTSQMPYEFEVIAVIEGSARHISELEHTTHKENKENKYLPSKSFAGESECFSSVVFRGCTYE